MTKRVVRRAQSPAVEKRTSTDAEPPRSLLPNVGELLAVPLDAGFWGACWIARRGIATPAVAHLGAHVVVASADWFDTEPPTLATLGVPRLLWIDHHGYDLPAAWNINEPLLPSIRSVGLMPSAPAVGEAPWVSSWSRMSDAMGQQREWNSDRPAHERAYAEQQLAWARQNAQERAAEQARVTQQRSVLTIAKLRRRKLLRAWDGAMPKRRLDEARAKLGTLLDALEERQGSSSQQLAALRALVLDFNRWNDQHGVIETGEREALYDELCNITAAAGLGDRTSEINRWRDW